MSDSSFYELKIDLNALNHLGINLYSNIPAVISETVANSWDADAKSVDIQINQVQGIITVYDDGHGMSRNDINKKYLTVGFDKRKIEGSTTPRLKRHVMGRKGIGKLSLFSIANIIEVHSVKSNRKNGFIMNASDIERAIKGNEARKYHPKPVPSEDIEIKKGTIIILRELKKGIKTTEVFLRKRLARRFSIISKENSFSVSVNGSPITVEDRDYFDKIEYLWHIGDGSEKYIKYCKNLKENMKIDGVVSETEDFEISGWIGTFDEQRSIEEGNNTIIVQAWGKLIHEDILKDLKEGGLFTKYLIGEIRADFLDRDDLEDIVTSDRQRLRENDPRFEQLKNYVQAEILKKIQSKWQTWRKEGAEKKALTNPVIKEWFTTLSRDNKKYARQLFMKIEAFPVKDPDFKKELYKTSILAFETLALKGNLNALDQIETSEDLKLFISIFTGMDELEAVHYYMIVKGRLGVLKKFEDIVPEAKEKIIQKHIFKHLWLLDTSWERASTDARMEQSVSNEWKKIDAKLSKKEQAARYDIKYRTAAGKQIIIELKKYDVRVEIIQLLKQIGKYRSALLKILKNKYPDIPPFVECICILGSPPSPKDQDEENRKMLAAIGARYITYDQLIKQTRDSYRDYLEKQKDITRLQALIDNI